MSLYRSIPWKQWTSAPCGASVHYFQGMERYSDILLYVKLPTYWFSYKQTFRLIGVESLLVFYVTCNISVIYVTAQMCSPPDRKNTRDFSKRWINVFVLLRKWDIIAEGTSFQRWLQTVLCILKTSIERQWPKLYIEFDSLCDMRMCNI